MNPNFIINFIINCHFESALKYQKCKELKMKPNFIINSYYKTV